MKRYRVANWIDAYETNETRKLVRLRWVPVPNRHDGLGFRRVAAREDRCEVYAGWLLTLEVASRMPVRGTLENEAGPLGAEDLALMTGFPAAIFERAFAFLSSPKIGWIIAEEVGGPEAPVPQSTKEAGNPPEHPENLRDAPEILPEVWPEGRNGRKESLSSPAGAADRGENIPFGEIKDLFHRLCPSLPRLRELTDTRRAAVRAGWKAANGRGTAHFEELFAAAEASNFLSGRNGEWAGCSFDWLLKPANAVKVLEGNYSNARRKPGGGQSAANGYLPKPKAPNCC